tara:strand:- start:584 stop:799 length:216 start_codon:yes stop_codon:yes gene_type:complete
MKTFSVEYPADARLNHSFKVRGICHHDTLNPCWDNRQSDIPGQHWGGGIACQPCTTAAEIDRKAERAERKA